MRIFLAISLSLSVLFGSSSDGFMSSTYFLSGGAGECKRQAKELLSKYVFLFGPF